MQANGTEGYQAYQINASGEQQSATTAGECYYIENRQKQGWDTYLPASGMLIWKVNYDARKWEDNAPNNTANKPRYTIVCSHGTSIGANYGKGNVFPYSRFSIMVDSWDGVENRPLTDITMSKGTVTLNYIHAGQGIDIVDDGKAARKILHEGNVVIIRNGNIYDISGRLIGTYENH